MPKVWRIVLVAIALPVKAVAAEPFGSPLGCALYEFGGVKAVIAGSGDVPATLWDNEPSGPLLVVGDLVVSIGASCPLSADRSAMSCVGEGEGGDAPPTKIPLSLTSQPDGTLLYQVMGRKPIVLHLCKSE